MPIDRTLTDELRDPQSEDQVVRIIKANLLQPGHKVKLRELDLSVEDVLNGRFSNDKSSDVWEILDGWNAECGEILFKF